MLTIVSIAVVVVTTFAAEWMVDGWIGEEGRFWFGIGGVGLLVFAGVLIKASGIEALTRCLRDMVLGAGLGAVLSRTGYGPGWLRKGMRRIGVETDPQGGPKSWREPRVSGRLLWLGWGATLVGIALVWTGLLKG